MNILVINGPNLNLLGLREPHIYGAETLEDVEAKLGALAADLGVRLSCFQSNHEGALVDKIQAARGTVDRVVINAGAYTHTGVAIGEAVAGVGSPIVAVQSSNVYAHVPLGYHVYLSDKTADEVVALGTF